MTPEISSYLLIRSLLINCTSDQIINVIREEKNFPYVVKTISALMQYEDFILLSDIFQKRVGEIIQAFRFDYNKDKSLNDEMNYIIGRLTEYKKMSRNRKIHIADNWCEEETKARNLPRSYQTTEVLFQLISLDCDYYNRMISGEGTFIVNDIIEYLSLVNLIINRFPDIVTETSFLERTKQNILILKEIKKMPFAYSNMIKKTSKVLSKIG